jgi:hypothetical protein
VKFGFCFSLSVTGRLTSVPRRAAGFVELATGNVVFGAAVPTDEPTQVAQTVPWPNYKFSGRAWLPRPGGRHGNAAIAGTEAVPASEATCGAH